MDGEDGDVDHMEIGDDSSSDSDAEMQQQITELEAVLAESLFQYDNHVELIQLLRQQGDLDKVRQARHNMSELFPLTQELWMEWLGDELPLASLPEAIVELRVLFEKAVGDYLSVPVWLEYAKFAVERMSVMPEGMEFPRDVFERGIIACGLHVSQAGALWDAYRQFEQAVLSSIQQMQQNDPGDDSLRSQVEAQKKKVKKLFERQLAVPLIGMESTFQEYQSFSDSVVVSEDNLPAYTRAKKKLEGYRPFENQLQSSTPPTLDSYRSYISHAKSTKADPTFLNTLYLQAIAHHCLDTELWKEYLTFLGQNFGRVRSVLLTGYKQAVRNCPWVVEFWTGYVRAQERLGEEHEEIVATFEKGLEGSFSEAKDYLQLWTAYCDYLRRRVGPNDNMDTSCLVELRKTFKRARDNLNACGGGTGAVAMGVMPSPSLTFPMLPAISASQGNPVNVVSVPSASPAIVQIAIVAKPQVVVPAGMFLGEGLVPLPAKLVQRVVNLEFVEMYELLPESWLVAKGNDSEGGGHEKLLALFPKRHRAPVTDVLVWAQCFSAMSTTYPDKVPEFMAYQALIVKCSRDYEGLGWVMYDRAFRRQVAVTKDLNWSKLNPTLHSLCLAGKARRNKFCSVCLSDNHATEQCPESWQGCSSAISFGHFRPSSPYHFPQVGPVTAFAQPPGLPPAPLPSQVCRLFNKPEGPRCTFSPCKFAHVCIICKGPHARSECKEWNAGKQQEA